MSNPPWACCCFKRRQNTSIQPLVAEDAEMAALVQQTILKMQQLNEQQFKGLELEWYKPDEPNKKTEVAEK